MLSAPSILQCMTISKRLRAPLFLDVAHLNLILEIRLNKSIIIDEKGKENPKPKGELS